MAEKKIVVKVAGKEIKLPDKRTEPTKGRPTPVVFEANPFVSATKVPRRVKAFFYGPTGSRKTITALKFPKPAVVDLEDGTKWYADQFSFDVVPDVKDFATYVGVIDYLATGNHPYLTFVTDPSTIVWELLQKQWSDTFITRNIGGKGFKFDFYNMQPGDWKHVKAEWKDTMKRLMDLDMHVIFTARVADLFADGGEMMRKIGERPDGEKNVRYYFDIVLRLDVNGQGETIATVEKDRTNKLPKEPFKLEYDIIEQAFGKEYLFREVDPTLMPEPSTIEPPPEVTITVEPGHDAISHETNGIDVDPPTEPPDPDADVEPLPEDSMTVKVTLPKEDLVECPGCQHKVPELKHHEEHGDLCPDCLKSAKKPEGSTGKPIKVVIKKGKKTAKTAAKPDEKKEEPKKEAAKPEAPTPELCTPQQEKDIREYCDTLGISEKKMMKSLMAYDAVDFATLTKEKADTILKNLDKKLREKR